jgi:hypothetical protein
MTRAEEMRAAFARWDESGLSMKAFARRVESRYMARLLKQVIGARPDA